MSESYIHIDKVVEADGKPRFRCPECGKAMATRQVVEKHLVSMHGDKYGHLGTPCTVCGKVFHKALLGAHLATHDDALRVGKRARPGEAAVDEDGERACPHCGQGFGSKAGYYTHMKAVHGVAVYKTAPKTDPRPPKRYPCNGACGVHDCAATFSHPQHVESHVAKATGIKTRVCEFCGSAFSNTSDLGKHKLACGKRPGAGVDTYPCTAYTTDGGPCTYVGASSTALAQHQRGPCHVHRPALFACPVPGCTYAHYTPSKLRQHAAIHEEDRPFACCVPDCGAAFKTNGDLKKHACVHETARDHACALCPATFTSDRYLANHLKAAHGAKMHGCEICGAQFTTKWYLDRHADTHSAVPGYECGTCGRCFRQKTVLDNHVAYVHTLHRPHACPVCDFVFTSPSRLAAHVKVHEVGFVPGKSAGERDIYAALAGDKHRFLTEFSFPGTRNRFDFAVYEPSGDRLQCLIEYDGKGHYGPIYDSRTCQEGFIQQVGRDLAKTRYAREHGVGLLRYTLSQYQDGQLAADITGRAWRTNIATYRDYVFGDVFLPGCVLVASAKAAAYSGPPPKAPMCDDAAAAELLLALPDVADLALGLGEEDDAGALFEFAALHVQAIVVVFAARHKAQTIAEVGAAISPRAAQAFVHLFLQVPEFFWAAHGADAEDVVVVPAAPTDAKTPRKRCRFEDSVDDDDVTDLTGVVDMLNPSGPMGPPHVCEKPPEPFMVCWMCDPPIEYKAKLNVGFTMLDHMATAHKGRHFPIGCPYCPPSAEHQLGAKNNQWAHVRGCTMDTETEAKRKYKRCNTCQVNFSLPHLLFRHLNDVHGAKFADVCTLKCSACSEIFRTSAALRQHVCRAR